MTKDQPLFDFDEADAELSLLPSAARRALDLAGVKLSLESFRSLSLPDRKALASAGARAGVELTAVHSILARAHPQGAAMNPEPDPDPHHVPDSLVLALGRDRPLSDATWAALRPLDRYALVKAGRRGAGERLARAYLEIVGAARRTP